jgi:sporulation protein YlmC with PRC-barrel domain
MNIVRDVLDKKILDCDGVEVGRVDGVLFEFEDGSQPRMTTLEIGGEILAARVARWLVPITRWLAAAWGPKRDAIVGIEWNHVARVERDLHLDIRADDTQALAWEHWLSDRVIKRIPGGR